MEDNKGFNIAIKVLGERIAQLESELCVERYYKDEYKNKSEMLLAENLKLNRRLEEVHHFVERMEEE